MDSPQVVLDADFIIHLCSIKNQDFFESFIQALDVQPIVSWYVAGELINCQKAKDLMNNGYIHVVYPDDFLGNSTQRKLFDMNVRGVAERVNGEPIHPRVDLFSRDSHICGKNIGEIISELMAKEMGLTLFASDDCRAKRYADTYINSESYILDVKNIADLLFIIAQKGKTKELKWKDIKHVLSHKRWDKYIGDLRELWVSD